METSFYLKIVCQNCSCDVWEFVWQWKYCSYWNSLQRTAQNYRVWHYPRWLISSQFRPLLKWASFIEVGRAVVEISLSLRITNFNQVELAQIRLVLKLGISSTVAYFFWPLLTYWKRRTFFRPTMSLTEIGSS